MSRRAPLYDVGRIAFDDNSAEHSQAVEWAIEQLEDARVMMSKPARTRSCARP